MKNDLPKMFVDVIEDTYEGGNTSTRMKKLCEGQGFRF